MFTLYSNAMKWVKENNGRRISYFILVILQWYFSDTMYIMILILVISYHGTRVFNCTGPCPSILYDSQLGRVRNLWFKNFSIRKCQDLYVHECGVQDLESRWILKEGHLWIIMILEYQCSWRYTTMMTDLGPRFLAQPFMCSKFELQITGAYHNHVCDLSQCIIGL